MRRSLISHARSILAAAAMVILSLPGMPVRAEQPAPSPATQSQPLSTRTYYLGFSGRVSERKALVGELHATVRASSTSAALARFNEEHAAGNLNCAAPHVGGEK